MWSSTITSSIWQFRLINPKVLYRQLLARQSDIPARNADFVNWTFLLVYPTVPACQTPVNLKTVNPRILALNCQLINPTVPACRLLNCQPDSSCSSTDNTSSNYHIELVFKLLNSSLSLLARLQALHISWETISSRTCRLIPWIHSSSISSFKCRLVPWLYSSSNSSCSYRFVA